MLSRTKTLLPLAAVFAAMLLGYGSVGASIPTSAPLPAHVLPSDIHVHQGGSCSAAAIAASPAYPQSAGTTVSLSATATCSGGATPEYKFWFLPPDGGWTVLSGWQASPYGWNTTGLAAGMYSVAVWVRHVGATEDAPEANDWTAYPLSEGTGAPPVALWEGVPICTDHNPTAWHALVKRNPDNSVNCTYTHEHHADPNTVNDLFGSPGAWFGSTGQAISYPWQTSSPAGAENNVKHEGYKWYVERDQPCRPAWEAPNDACIVAHRVLVHTLGTAADATVRFHSYSMELLVEHNGVRGIVRHGGHLDFGHLSLLANGAQKVCPPTSTVPTNPPSYSCGNGNHREHGGANLPAPYQDGSIVNTAWYANHAVTSLSTSFEEWGPVDYQSPSVQHYYPEPGRNNSYGGLGNMSFNGSHGALGQYVGQDGLTRFDGHTDRHGNFVSGCAAPGPDCVPLKIEAVPYVIAVWNSGIQGDSVHDTDHDVPSPATGNSLVRFPN